MTQPRVYVYEGVPVTVEVDEFGHVLATAPPAPIAVIVSVAAAHASTIRILCLNTWTLLVVGRCPVPAPDTGRARVAKRCDRDVTNVKHLWMPVKDSGTVVSVFR